MIVSIWEKTHLDVMPSLVCTIQGTDIENEIQGQNMSLSRIINESDNGKYYMSL